MNAREEILRRIRAAGAHPGPGAPAVAAAAGPGAIPRDYRQAGAAAHDSSAPGSTTLVSLAPGSPGRSETGLDGPHPDLIDLFAERVADYRATVRRCPESRLAATVAEALAARGARRLMAPGGFPSAWLAAPGTEPGIETGIEAVTDDPPLGVADLDRLDGVVTTCALAIATTGTIVLDHGPGQGRRALTLVPDYHLAVVRAGQIVRDVPEAIAALDPARPLTWISGPSATSDIELSRVEGVHGPRTLDVVIVETR